MALNALNVSRAGRKQGEDCQLNSLNEMSGFHDHKILTFMTFESRQFRTPYSNPYSDRPRRKAAL